MSETYSASQLLSRAELSYRQLDCLVADGVVRTLTRRAPGSGRRRVFSERDVAIAEIVALMAKRGCGRYHQRLAADTLYDVVDWPWAAGFLLVDGRRALYRSEDDLAGRADDLIDVVREFGRCTVVQLPLPRQ